MPDMKTFKIRARKFVIDALTEANGYAPAPKVIESTVTRLVNTFKPLLESKNFPQDDEPKLSDLKGVAPDAAGNSSSEDFIRSIRPL